MMNSGSLGPGELSVRALALLALWWVLTEGALESFWVGIPAVLVALYFSAHFGPRRPVLLLELLRFLPLFLIRSLVAAIDVASRALAPAMRLQPALLEYRMALPPGLPRVFFANAVSLLPGTLSADLDDAMLCVHVLDDSAANEQSLRELEAAVALVFPRD